MLAWARLVSCAHVEVGHALLGAQLLAYNTTSRCSWQQDASAGLRMFPPGQKALIRRTAQWRLISVRREMGGLKVRPREKMGWARVCRLQSGASWEFLSKMHARMARNALRGRSHGLTSPQAKANAFQSAALRQASRSGVAVSIGPLDTWRRCAGSTACPAREDYAPRSPSLRSARSLDRCGPGIGPGHCRAAARR